MSKDLAMVMLWMQLCLIIAAVCTTAFPLLYAFSRWRTHLLGKVLMWQSVSLAAAIDLTLLFQFWEPDITKRRTLILMFGMNAFVLTMIAGSSLTLTALMWRLNHSKKGDQNGGISRLRRSARRSEAQAGPHPVE